MTKLKNTLWLIAILPFFNMAQTAYQDDPVDFYVENNAANDALEQLNFVMCMMSNMGMDKMVNRGKYKVSLYEDDCEKSIHHHLMQKRQTKVGSTATRGRETLEAIPTKRQRK